MKVRQIHGVKDDRWKSLSVFLAMTVTCGPHGLFAASLTLWFCSRVLYCTAGKKTGACIPKHLHASPPLFQKALF